MCEAKFKPVFILLLFLGVNLSNGMPQGFFSQGFSIPKFVPNLSNIKIESPIKTSLFNIFGKQNKANNIGNPSYKNELQAVNEDNTRYNTVELKPNENLLGNVDNGPRTTNQAKEIGDSNKYIQGAKLTNVYNKDEGLINKFNIIEENGTDNDIDPTTEFITETTTADYESTTIEELINRASPQLVASLLG